MEPFSGKLSALRELDREQRELYTLTVEARRPDIKRSKREIATYSDEHQNIIFNEFNLDTSKQVAGQDQVT